MDTARKAILTLLIRSFFYHPAAAAAGRRRAARRLLLAAGFAQLGNERVGCFQHAVKALGHAGVHVVAPGDAETGGGLHVVGVLQLDGAPDLAGHAKGFVSGSEFGAIHAALGHSGLHLFQRVQALFLVEDGVEDFGVDFFIQAHGLQREEDALQRLKGIGKAHVHAAHHHILRLGGGLEPGFGSRLSCMSTVVSILFLCGVVGKSV